MFPDQTDTKPDQMGFRIWRASISPWWQELYLNSHNNFVMHDPSAQWQAQCISSRIKWICNSNFDLWTAAPVTVSV